MPTQNRYIVIPSIDKPACRARMVSLIFLLVGLVLVFDALNPNSPSSKTAVGEFQIHQLQELSEYRKGQSFSAKKSVGSSHA
jgi:hypothetical protein